MSTPVSSAVPPRASGSSRTIWTAVILVVIAHILAIGASLMSRTEPIVVTPPHVVAATLISPEPAPVPVPVAAPEPPKPVEPPKPPVKTPPKVVRRVPTPHPTPTPTPVAAAEAPTPPAPAAPSAAPPAPPAPAPAPAIDPNIPKDVRHLTCVGTPPAYPPLSRRRGETGTVVIQFVVDTRGNVESARVKTSSGFERLDEAARAATLASPCTPYMEGGRAVKAITERPYNFSLSN